MTYNLTRVGVDVRLDPKAATRTILRVFRACKADAASAAARLGVSRRTFDRWVRLLGLEPQVAMLREKHSSSTGPERGRRSQGGLANVRRSVG